MLKEVTTQLKERMKDKLNYLCVQLVKDKDMVKDLNG